MVKRIIRYRCIALFCNNLYSATVITVSKWFEKTLVCIFWSKQLNHCIALYNGLNYFMISLCSSSSSLESVLCHYFLDVYRWSCYLYYERLRKFKTSLDHTNHRIILLINYIYNHVYYFEIKLCDPSQGYVLDFVLGFVGVIVFQTYNFTSIFTTFVHIQSQTEYLLCIKQKLIV